MAEPSVSVACQAWKEGKPPGAAGGPDGCLRARVLLGLRLRDDDGLALAGQEPLLGVQTDRVHGHGRALAQQPHHTGHGPQPPGSVPDDDDVRIAERGLVAVLLGSLLAGVEELGQLTDAGADGLGVRADEDVGVLGAGGPAVREPAHPVPAVLAAVLRQDVELDVQRAVQDRGLRDGPTAQRLGRVTGSGDADDTALGERQGDRRVLDVPGDLALVVVLFGVVEHDLGRHPSGADAQQQMVRVRAPPLPQPGARTGAQRQHGGRIGDRLSPVEALGEQGLLGVLLDPRLVLVVLLHLLGMGLAALLLVHEVVAEHDQRAQQRHDHVVPAPEDHHHDDGADQRRQRHQPGQRPGLVVPYRARQPELRLALRRVQPRRPVVVERGAVLRPLERRVGLGVTV